MTRAAAHHILPDSLTRGGSIGMALAQTLLMFGFTTLPTPLYGDYARQFGFSNLILTLIYATYVAGTLSMLFILGRLSDQIGRKPIALAAITTAIIAAALFATARNTAMLFAARLTTGIAAGLSSGTMVAWLKELHRGDQAKTASLRIVAINLLGLAVGPLLCGLLAEYAPVSFVTPYLIYVVLLAALAVGIAFARDTVERPKALADVTLRVRVGVPAGLRRKFLAPGIANFVLYSMVGFYSALAPGLIAKNLHITSHAISGVLVAELFLASAITVYVSAPLSSRAAMLWGFVLMLPTLGLLMAAEALASLPALIAGTAIGGVALGAGYRGAIEVGNQIAPKDKRAELISMLFVCGNLGLALPVIGIALLGTIVSPLQADKIFGGLTALLSLAGLASGFFLGEPSQEA